MRWTIWFILITIAALLISIMVAWGCALWSPPYATAARTRITAENPLVQPLLAHGRFDRFGSVREREGLGWRWERIIALDTRYTIDSPMNRTHTDVYRAGWPWWCLVGEARTIHGVAATHGLLPIRAIPWLGITFPKSLPLRPLWPALAGNMLVFAAALVAIRQAALLVRSRWRRRRGCCPRCGYDLRGQRPEGIRCPECGG